MYLPPVGRAAAQPVGAGGVGLAWHALVWGLLSASLLGLLLSPQMPVAGRNPLLAVATATTAGVVGLALLQLGLLRFRTFGQPVDVLAGLAFGILAAASLAQVLGLATGVPHGLAPGPAVYLVLWQRFVAAALLALGVALAHHARPVPPPARQRWLLRTGGLVALATLAGLAALLSTGDTLPRPVDPRAGDLLAAGTTILEALPGQSSLLLAADGLTAVLLLGAALGYVALARRLADPHVGWLALALALLFFSQLHGLLFPPLAVDYVSTGDGLRLGAYLVLLFSLVSRLSGEIAERASREERLRLSRELHDGLAQQLGLLNLRLSRAASPGRATDSRARDLEAAKRLVEVALLEARQAITALRTGAVTWEDVQRTLATFIEEFGQNHEMDARLAVQGRTAGVDAELQAEVLRILHEALSNAVRHGRAERVDVLVSASARLLEVRVRDEGGGFDARATLLATAGVGLRSIGERLERRGGTLHLASTPGQGATLTVRVPLSVPRSC